jgi:hypothetical protein
VPTSVREEASMNCGLRRAAVQTVALPMAKGGADGGVTVGCCRRERARPGWRVAYVPLVAGPRSTRGVHTRMRVLSTPMHF